MNHSFHGVLSYCPAWSLLSETRDNTIVAQASSGLDADSAYLRKSLNIWHLSQALSLSLSLLYADYSGFGSFDTWNRGELPSSTFALGKPAHISGSQN
jgi:hypothetical protein